MINIRLISEDDGRRLPSEQENCNDRGKEVAASKVALAFIKRARLQTCCPYRYRRHSLGGFYNAGLPDCAEEREFRMGGATVKRTLFRLFGLHCTAGHSQQARVASKAPSLLFPLSQSREKQPITQKSRVARVGQGRPPLNGRLSVCWKGRRERVQSRMSRGQIGCGHQKFHPNNNGKSVRSAHFINRVPSPSLADAAHND